MAVPRLYIHPRSGNDGAAGDLNTPLRTLGAALKRARPGTIVQLAMGFYRANTGEQFPLLVPEGVILLGDEPTKGQGIVIEGGGDYTSPSLGSHNVALLLANESQVRGLTVTNPNDKGTGIWIEATNAIVANSTLLNCGREGILVTGLATPLLRDNVFQSNQASGLAMLRNSKGEIWGNIYRQMQIGIALGGDCAPLLVKNLVSANGVGMAIAGNARPVLRNNIIENNRENGLVLQGDAQPDLGSSQDPAGNILRNNTGTDLSNNSNSPLVSVGNQIVPTRVQGRVDFQPSELATPLNVPEPVLEPIVKTAYPDLIPVPNPNVPLDGFPDIENHWATAFIQAMLERKLITGFPDRTFRPESPLTRAQFAALVAQAFDLPQTRPQVDFQDMAPNFWARKAVLKAVRMGFMAGFPDGTFRGNQQLTRVQAIVALVNGLNLSGGTPNLLTVYSDRAQIPSFATNAIAAATQNRLIVNYPQLNLLEPLRAITRAETAVMVYQALVVQRQAPVIEFPYLPQPILPATLPDIQGHWSEVFIRALVSQNLLRSLPDGAFRPDATVNRAEFAVLLAQAFNPVARNPLPTFVDVPSEFMARGAIEQVVRGGFMAGSSSNRFLPERPMPRCQVLISLVRGLQLRGGEVSLLQGFGDQETVPNYARPDMAVAVQHRLVISYPDPRLLSPMREVTRGEAAAMIYQGLLCQGRVGVLPSAYVALPRSHSETDQT